MGYWITLKKDEVRRGFSAATPQEALAVVEAKQIEGYEEVRVIDPDGSETSAYALRVALGNMKAEAI